jgi:COP9 signalosome complex subunit 6
MAETSANPLLSTARASDTSPTIQLHPLVLLTISDCITRHTLRQQEGPIAGAILGQQNGQEITMEVAFQAKLQSNANGEVVLDDEWFSKRLEDCTSSEFTLYIPSGYVSRATLLTACIVKDVHKQPQLDIVGWFTLGAVSGPQPHILPIHARISEVYMESPLLCLFHPSNADSEATAAGKLPLTIYESVYESATGGPNDKVMDVDGVVQNKALKFRELVYSIETGEAEMIAVDFVARGGGNATAVDGSTAAAPKGESSKTEEDKGRKLRGKQKEKEKKEETIDESGVLTVEDDELLSTLTAKMNAIRMLSRRISLIRTYLASLPPSHLSDPSLPINPTPSADHPLPLNHSILRGISAMLARINILAPPDTEAFTLESQQEASDVQLIQLLSSITNSVSAAKDLGKKSQIIENNKSQSRRNMGTFVGGGHEGGGGSGGGSQYFDNMLGGGGGSGRQFGNDRWG